MEFLWWEAAGFVLPWCPLCAELFGFEKDDNELDTLFSKDCKIGRILKRHGFNLKMSIRSGGLISFEVRKIGYDLIRELKMKLKDVGGSSISRMNEIVRVYGLNEVRYSIFIFRFNVVNLFKEPSLGYTHRVKFVPAFATPYAPYGVIQAVSHEESELELEKLLFYGGSKIKERIEEATQI